MATPTSASRTSTTRPARPRRDRRNRRRKPCTRLQLDTRIEARIEAEAERRKGLVALNDLIDMQMRDADKLDKNNDGKISQQEYLVLAGPADGPQSQGLLPYDIRKQLTLIKVQAIDANKDGIIDRPELAAYALKEFLETDTNKDRFLDQEEVKKFQEAEAAHDDRYGAFKRQRSRCHECNGH